eukprot:6356188-Amphidinium_carterae.1
MSQSLDTLLERGSRGEVETTILSKPPSHRPRAEVPFTQEELSGKSMVVDGMQIVNHLNTWLVSNCVVQTLSSTLSHKIKSTQNICSQTHDMLCCYRTSTVCRSQNPGYKGKRTTTIDADARDGRRRRLQRHDGPLYTSGKSKCSSWQIASFGDLEIPLLLTLLYLFCCALPRSAVSFGSKGSFLGGRSVWKS